MAQRGPIDMGMGGRRCRIRTAWAAELQECQVLSQARERGGPAARLCIRRACRCPPLLKHARNSGRHACKSTVRCEISMRSTASQRPFPYMGSSSSFVKVTGDGYLDVFLARQRQKRRRVRRNCRHQQFHHFGGAFEEARLAIEFLRGGWSKRSRDRRISQSGASGASSGVKRQGGSKPPGSQSGDPWRAAGALPSAAGGMSATPNAF